MTLSLAFLTPDFLVELRGFEPLTSVGVGARAIDGGAASGSPFSVSCGFSDKKKAKVAVRAYRETAA
jgi:hypothetical protein